MTQDIPHPPSSYFDSDIFKSGWISHEAATTAISMFPTQSTAAASVSPSTKLSNENPFLDERNEWTKETNFYVFGGRESTNQTKIDEFFLRTREMDLRRIDVDNMILLRLLIIENNPLMVLP